jgi:hypothetical protein
MSMSRTEPARDEISEPAGVLGYEGLRAPPMVAVVWCRIFALSLLANGLTDGASFVGYVASRLTGSRFQFQDDLSSVILFSSILPCSVFLLMAWYCWRRAPTLARRMTEGLDPGPSQRGITSGELLHLILMGIGVYLLTTGIPSLAWLLLLLITMLRNGPPATTPIDANIISSIVRCSLGLWLILGTRGIAQLVRRYSGGWHDESKGSGEESNSKPE